MMLMMTKWALQQKQMSQLLSTMALQPQPQKMIKGIVCGDRCDDGAHNYQPCDNNVAATTMMTTTKMTMTLTTMMMMMTRATVTAEATTTTTTA
jgi:hypothetical protein